MSRQRRCPECGQGRIHPQAKPGRTERYKTMEALPLPDDLLIPTCDVCGAEWMDARTAKAVDEALEITYQRELSTRAQAALERLVQQTTQRELEHLLGLSHGYLSKLRSGSSTPSPELVSHLAMLAADPKRRLVELRAFWDSRATAA